MKIGYCRISTSDQSLDLQKDALREAGCERIYEDIISGSKFERKGLKSLNEHLREGDILVVWRLDRLGRSLKNLIEIVNDLNERNIGFMSLQESIDTTTAGGKLVFHIFGAMAEFERNIIRERTMAGLEAARARGRKGGRPVKLSGNKRGLLIKLYKEKKYTIPEICELMGVSKTTLYRYLN